VSRLTVSGEFPDRVLLGGLVLDPHPDLVCFCCLFSDFELFEVLAPLGSLARYLAEVREGRRWSGYYFG